MKKLSSILLTGIVCVALSCTNGAAHETGMSDKARKNLEATKGVTKMFESGDFSKTADYIAADAVDHWTPMGHEVKGVDSIKAMFSQWGSTMKDTKIEIVKEWADDDYATIWLKQSWTATQDDPMMHMKAGDKGTMESVEVTKHNADGKVTDHWGFASLNDMMKMMPTPTAPMKVDTTVKK
jgi:hypothetical protein